MDNKIILKDGKELIGVSNITVSEHNDQIYLINTAQIKESIAGSIAFYYRDDLSAVMGTGMDCVWDDDTSTLHLSILDAKTILSDNIITTNLTSENIVSINSKIDNIETQNLNVSECTKTTKLSIGKWLGFDSRDTNDQPFKISVSKNPLTNKELLLFSTNDYTNSTPKSILAFEDNRIYIAGVPNIIPTAVNSPVGQESDIKGDIAIDEDFIYFCVKDYDGKTNIWKRCALQEW